MSKESFNKRLAATRQILGNDNALVKALEAVKIRLVEGSDNEDWDAAFNECVQKHQSAHPIGAVVHRSEDEEFALYTRNVNAVDSFLQANDWHYSSHEPRKGVTIFDLGVSLESCKLRVRVYVESDPSSCRIDALLPVAADIRLEYPLCATLAKENFDKRFGSFKYDERDGEISYEYTIMTGHGLHIDDFSRALHICMFTAAKTYDLIFKHCVGKFKNQEINEILRKVNDLVVEINN